MLPESGRMTAKAIVKLNAETLQVLLSSKSAFIVGRTGRPLNLGASIKVNRMWYTGEIEPAGILNVEIEHPDLYEVCDGCEIPVVQLWLRINA